MKAIGMMLAFAATALISQLAGAQVPQLPPDPQDLVKATLIADAEAVQAGNPFTVGVLLTIEPQWHVYWKNPGDAGLATQIEFTVPQGYSVSPIAWPHPTKFTQPGDIVGYGYEEQVLLSATVSPPQDAQPTTPVTVSAQVSWLACQDKCIPGKASLTLEVATVADAEQAQPANAELFEAWAKRVDPLAPDFVLKDQDGQQVTLSELRGNVVVLEWFNPDCPFVQRHHAQRPTMVDLAHQYGRDEVKWLAINSTHSMDTAANKRWHEQWELPYPLLVDQDGAVGRAYEAKTTPHMFVISPEGRIVYEGAIDDDAPGQKSEPRNYVDQALSQLLAGTPVSEARTKPYGCSVKYAEPVR
jgi:DsbC/DsbD-like thiol-disulfide interchange protein